MIVVIGDKHYPHVQIEDLSLGHVMALQRELVLTNISSARSWGDVRALVAEFAALPENGRGDHPEFLFLTALTVWAARVTAGERISLLDAIDVPLAAIKFVAEPHDRKAAASAEGKARRASAPGGASRRGKPAKKAKPKTSGNPSMSESSPLPT